MSEITRVGVDLAKKVFEVCGVDAQGSVAMPSRSFQTARNAHHESSRKPVHAHLSVIPEAREAPTLSHPGSPRSAHLESSRKPAQRAIRDPGEYRHRGKDRRGFWIPGLASLARNDEKEEIARPK